jgi:RNA polymerase sigma-70 factor, ECF subfamily
LFDGFAGKEINVSSSFPAARFPALMPSKEQGEAKATYPLDSPEPASGVALSDESLIARIRSEDQEALAILFRRYARLVWSIAERIVRDKGEADDLLQDVFLWVYRKASVFDSSKGTPRSLIVHMTYQRAITRRNYLAARHGRTPHEPRAKATPAIAQSTPLYHESVEAHYGREGLRRALDEMSEDQKRTLQLYFFEGYTLAEIAEEMGQALGNVKHHYYRGLQKLRSHLPSRTWESENSTCRGQDGLRAEQCRTGTGRA